MSILAAFMVPHPPMIVPEVGRGSQAQVEKTISAYRQVAQQIADLKPDTILISSPHATMYMDYFHISKGESARGSFADFRAPKVRFDESYDSALVQEICRIADKKGFPAGTLDFRVFFRRDGKTRPDGFPEFTAEFKAQDGALVSASAQEKPFVRAVSGPISRVGNIFTDSAVFKQDLQVQVFHDNIHQTPP